MSVDLVKRVSIPALRIKNIKIPADTAKSIDRESSVRTAALPSTLENIIAGLKTLTTSRERQALPDAPTSFLRWHKNPTIINKNITNICCPAVITFIFFVPFISQYFYYTENNGFHNKNLDFIVGIEVLDNLCYDVHAGFWGKQRRGTMKKKINFKEYLVLIVGMFIISAAVYYLMMPSKVVVGSISGLVMVLSNFLPFKISTMTLVLNMVLLLLGFIFIGKDFGVKTVITSILLPVFLGIFEVVTPKVPALTDDPLINMVCYVLVVSFGQAMLFNANASSGGLDIVAKFMNKYFHMELGKALTIIGFLTAASAVFVYDRKTLAVSLLGTYLCGMILDNFIDGFKIRKRVCILSEHHQQIQEFIVHTLHRGATLYPAYGGYDNKEKTEVLTILTRNEYAQLLNYIHESAPDAFVTVSTVGEVIGEWNANQRKGVK